MNKYHQPVLLQPCIDGLNIIPSGIYVDVTFGGGGHSRHILSHLNSEGKLFAFDQDEDAHRNKFDDARFTLIDANFRNIENYLRFYQTTQVDGILADLGVSSHQFDEGDRGFSFRQDAVLDLRMNRQAGISALELVNTYEAEKLAYVLKIYGELDQSRRIANTICTEREKNTIRTTFDLVEVTKRFSQKGKENKFYAKLFQALRIEVNDELGALKELLIQGNKCLKPGGRFVVMSYNSLEDRLVKNYFKTGNFEGIEEKDFYGNLLSPLKPVNRKVIIPDDSEIEQNNRARSAKLRIAEKV